MTRVTKVSGAPSISASSASGVVTGRLQVWPWHSMATGAAARRQVVARRAVRPQAPVEAQHGQRRVGRAQRDRRERLRRADRRAARRRRSSRRAPACRRPSSRSGLPPSPSGAPEKARMRPSAASRQRASSVRCQSRAKTSASRPTPDGVAPSWAWRGRAPGTSAASLGGQIDAALAVAEQVERLGSRGVAAASRSAGSPLASNRRERGAGHRRVIVEHAAGAGTARPARRAGAARRAPRSVVDDEVEGRARASRASPARRRRRSRGPAPRSSGRSSRREPCRRGRASGASRAARKASRARRRGRASSSGEPRGAMRRSTVRPSQLPSGVTS